MKQDEYDRRQAKIGEGLRKSLPKSIRDYYVCHFQLIGSRRVGTFVGLACRCCGRWFDMGHDKGCPVPAPSKAVLNRYKAFLEKV